MRTLKLTGHLFTAFLALAAAAMTMTRMGMNMAAGTRTEDMVFLLLAATLAYAAYSIAATITIITEEKPS